ncbi:HNH endonuclease [Pseudomonas aeruginosa]|nr:HNH endonuclease [Pseudomonas aeruginosa]MBG5519187.1 HNH endonuclease [Pseudomonas aeruginosa]
MHATPTRTVLNRTYRIKKSEQHRTEELSEDLWNALSHLLSPSVSVECLRDIDVLSSILSERLVNYTFSRLVIGGCYWLDNNGTPDDPLQLVDGMLIALREVLDVPNKDVEQRVAYLMSRICVRVTCKQSKLNSTQVKAIRKFATNNGHRCYICGAELHYGENRPYGSDLEESIDKKREKRSFEIEHIWGQARGGSRSRNNLAACCKACNKLKSHLISFVDLPIEQSTTNARDVKSISSAINHQYRFALIWKQGGRCGFCEKHFYDIESETMYLVQREKSQPLHFLNLQIVCLKCNHNQSLEGVKIRA